jgi:flagellar biosynthesis GTPase FlhF
LSSYSSFITNFSTKTIPHNLLFILAFVKMPTPYEIRMAELREELAFLERKNAEEAQRAKEERIVKEAEEAQLAKIEEEKRIAEEERKRREEEERRQAEEQRQAAIALAEYWKNVEKAEADKIEAARRPSRSTKTVVNIPIYSPFLLYYL